MKAPDASESILLQGDEKKVQRERPLTPALSHEGRGRKHLSFPLPSWERVRVRGRQSLENGARHAFPIA